MKKVLAVLFVSLLVASSTAFAEKEKDGGDKTTVSPFDAAYTVASNGSTTQVTTFDINGPAPWLYLVLPTAGTKGFDSKVKSDWFLDSSSTKKFKVDDNGTTDSQFAFWLTPTDKKWDNTKALGDWHIDTSFLWKHEDDRIIGSKTVNFTVTPEPASMALFGLGAGILGMTRLRRKKKTV